jgi:hypothetical protein
MVAAATRLIATRHSGDQSAARVPPFCTEMNSLILSAGGAQNGTFCRVSYLLANTVAGRAGR